MTVVVPIAIFYRAHNYLSSRATRGILVFARGGDTCGAGRNQDPSRRSG